MLSLKHWHAESSFLGIGSVKVYPDFDCECVKSAWSDCYLFVVQLITISISQTTHGSIRW